MQGDTAQLGWRANFRPADKVVAADFVGYDERLGVDIKRDLRSVRELRAHAVQAALELDRLPNREAVWLVFVEPALSLESIQREWAAMRRLFAPAYAQRIVVAVLTRENFWAEPICDELQRAGNALRQSLLSPPPVEVLRPQGREHRKYYEIVKALLERWLLGEAPLPIVQLGALVNASYPTLRSALRKLELDKCLLRHSNRSVALSRFPNQAWRELIALGDRLRPPLRFVDVSGGQPDPLDLLARVAKLKPNGVAVGGVVAARHWDAEFDLHGTPRLDLAVHAPQGSLDASFVKRLDPALKPTEDPDASPVLVLHSLARAATLFDAGTVGLPVANAVETALDLCEMGLSRQADELFQRLRRRSERK